MGKPTGFLEYTRQGNPSEAPLARIRHYNEFHPRLGREERMRQGARCMECGVPFCQSGAVLGGMVSGCPLHNLVPEWNDLVYHGSFGHALERLLKTNNFPEFTGRVCPALCEAACTCGLHGEPVTVRDNELGIIEDAWERGLMKPRPPKNRTGKRIAVVGSGPSGLACADQLNSRGHSVTLFEREDRPGGLLMYGIPNMKLEKSIVQRRLELMAAQGVEFRTGVDVGRDISARELRRDYDAAVLCCGAANPRDLDLPGREGEGVWFAVDFLKETTRALLDNGLQEAIAVFGSDPRIYETTVSRLIRDEGGALTAVETVRLGPDHKPLPGTEQTLPCELLLIAAGFLGPQDYVPEAFGLARTARSNVQTAEGGYDTGVAGVFAAGDMRRGQSLVVWAIQEGRAAARQVDEYLMGYTNLE